MFPPSLPRLLLVTVCVFQAFTAHAADALRIEEMVKPRLRVIIDNDFGGDPDGLFQLAHHLLSPAVEVRGIIGSHHYPDGFYGYPGSPEHAVATAGQLLSVMDLAGKVPLLPGAKEPLQAVTTPLPSEAARFIVQEAMRDDASTPLYVACGAGLTDLASAYLLEPKIAKRIRLIWIGGPEHAGLAQPPPGKAQGEYNLGIDPKACQVVFNTSDIPIWQVPRDVYRQALVSYSELNYRMKPDGRLARFLIERLQDLMTRSNQSLGEAYVLGDSPLVLLTALQSSWDADPSSSRYNDVKAPQITDSGWYESTPNGRLIRVYTSIDTRVMFEDFYAKIAQFDQSK